MPRLRAADADEKIRSLEDAIAVRPVRDIAQSSARLPVDAMDTCSQVTLDGWGHPSYQIPSRFINEARMRYLVRLITPRSGTHCRPDEVPFH